MGDEPRLQVDVPKAKALAGLLLDSMTKEAGVELLARSFLAVCDLPTNRVIDLALERARKAGP